MGEVRRVYVEKKKDYAVKAKELHASLKQYLGLDVESVRVLVRYDIENLSDASYEKALVTVFSEPPVDDVYEETLPLADGEISLNPSRILTSAGSSKSITNVSGLSAAASLESTGLMQYSLTASNCSSVKSPFTT